ncbi:MAG: hypothetical protein QOE53_1378 [Pseudonocardiales bacterium]|nr:hypothetical protein [Pseudonocardiales bacterium]
MWTRSPHSIGSLYLTRNTLSNVSRPFILTVQQRYWPSWKDPPSGAKMTDVSASSGFDVAKLVTGGLALLSAVGGLVGTFTGGLPRLLRNHPGNLILVTILVVSAVILGFIASELPSEAKWKVGQKLLRARVVLSVGALVVFGGAAVVLVIGLQQSIQHSDQPRLSASWTFPTSRQPVLTVHMRVNNLKAKETVYVNVTPLGSPTAAPVYRSQTGANADGVADEKFDVAVPVGQTGLQVVAAVGQATTCQGNRIPELVLPEVENAASTNASVVASPTPSNQPTATGVLPPVADTKPLSFSCIQVAVPAVASTPSAATSAASPKPSPR